MSSGRAGVRTTPGTGVSGDGDRRRPGVLGVALALAGSFGRAGRNWWCACISIACSGLRRDPRVRGGVQREGCPARRRESAEVERSGSRLWVASARLKQAVRGLAVFVVGCGAADRACPARRCGVLSAGAAVVLALPLLLTLPAQAQNVLPPGAPTGLDAVSVGQTDIEMTWTAPSDDGGAAVTSYGIEAKTGGNWGRVWTTSDAGTTFTYRGLMPGTTYELRVVAINAAGTGAPSNEVASTTDHPLPASVVVPAGWSLTPSGLTGGSRFRLLAVESKGLNCRSRDIGRYNRHFIHHIGNSGHTDIRAYADGFRVLGSTERKDARDNTGTTGTGVPIYWLNGDQVADDNADLYDGGWNSHAARWPSGNAANPTFVKTGSTSLGTSDLSHYFGAAQCRTGKLVGGQEFRSDTLVDSPGSISPFYVLSQEFVVPEVPTIASTTLVSNPGPDGFYVTGDTIELAVEFSEPVNVTGQAGLQASLFIGASNSWRGAQYESGDGTDTLRFHYTVGAADRDSDGVTIGANGLAVGADPSLGPKGGGTIQSVATGFDADLTNPIIRNIAEHKIAGLPGAPTGLDAVSVGQTDIEMTWTAPSDNGGAAVTGYGIEAKTGGNWGRVWTTSDAGTTFTYRGLMPGTTYELRVVAINAAGAGAPSNEVTSTTDHPLPPSVTVPAGWSLIPDGLTGGSRFRLLVVEGKELTCQSRDIGRYNRHFIYHIGNSGHADIRTYADGFRVLGSTQRKNARDNTGTTGTGVAIYWLNGDKVADDNADLYDGSWASQAARNPSGNTASVPDAGVKTGSNSDGTSDGSYPLGGTNCGAGTLSPGQELSNGLTAVPADVRHPFYVLSQEFEVARQATGVDSLAVTSDPNEDGRTGDDDTYAIGDAIEITATFNEAVTVTGTPQLALKVGDGTRQADYASGSGSTALVFSYTVVEDDEATGGVEIEANKLALNGGTIKTGTTDATLTHGAEAANSEHKVDGVRPTFVSAETSEDGESILVTFSETIASVNHDFFQWNGVPVGANASSSRMGSVVTIRLHPHLAIDHGDTVGIEILFLGAVRDAAGNRNARVDGLPLTNTVPAPAVSIELTSDPGGDGTYAIGDTIEVKVTFSEAVTVDTTSGTPNFALKVGNQTRKADVDSGSGTTGLVFKYTVVEGDEDTDGIEIEAGAIELNGGTIKVGTTDAMLSYVAVAADSEHKVDGVRPTVVDGSAESSTDGLRITMTFDEDLSSMTAAAGAFTLAAAPGTAPGVSGVSASAKTVTLTLDGALVNGQTVSLTYDDPDSGADDDNAIQDAVGNDADSFTDYAVTNNVPVPWTVTVDPAAIAELGDVVSSTLTVSTGGATFPDEQTIALELSGTAVTSAGDDFRLVDADGNVLPLGGSLTGTLAAGETELSFTIAALADDVDELDETLVIQAKVGAGTLLDPQVDIGEAVTVTIRDVPFPWSVTAEPATIAEVGGIGVVTVSTGGATLVTARTITLTLGGTAIEDDDYEIDSKSLLLPAGGSLATAVIRAVSDTDIEGAETVTIAAMIDTEQIGETVTVTISEVEPPGAPRNVAASAGAGKVRLTWQAPASQGGGAVTGYEYRRKEGTGAYADTWTAAETVAFGSGSHTTVLGGDGTTLDDYAVAAETSYTYELRAVNAGGGGAAAESNAAATGAAMTVKVVVAKPEVAENEGPVAATVVAEMPATSPNGAKYDLPFEVNVYTESDFLSATIYDDFQPRTAIPVFAPSDFAMESGRWVARKPFEVTLVDDADAEPDETFLVAIERGTRKLHPFVEIPGATAEATVTIVNDDEPAIELVFEIDGSEVRAITEHQEDAGTVTLALRARTAMAFPPAADFAVTFNAVSRTAKSPGDFVAPALAFAFDADGFELDNGQYVQTVSKDIEIVDDEVVERKEYFEIALDKTTLPGHATFLSASDAAEIVFEIHNDDTATVRIVEDVRVLEGEAFEVTLESDAAAEFEFTVHVGITGDDPLSKKFDGDPATAAHEPLSFTKFETGETRATATAKAVDDGLVEDDETFEFEFSRHGLDDAILLNNDPVRTVTIVNDDHAPTVPAQQLKVLIGQTDAGRVRGHDEDEGDELAWTLVGGADAALFTLAGDGSLRLNTARPSLDDPGDAGGDPGVYELTVEVTDGFNTATGDITVRLEDKREPSAPTGFRWTREGASGGTVTLVWGPPHDDGNRPILRYEISGESGAWETVPGGADAREITYTGLDHNELYVFGLRAVNEVGPGTKTTSETVILRAGAPEAPRNLVSEATSVHEVRLAWERPSHGADIEIIGYRFEVSLDGRDWSYSGFTQDRAYEERTYGVPGLAGDEFRLDDRTPSTRDSIGRESARHYRVAALYAYRPEADDPHVARGRSPFSAPVRASTQGYALTHPLAGFALNDRTYNGPSLRVEDGATLVLSDPAGASHSIRALLEQGASVASVHLELSGRVSHERTENETPYQLFGDGVGPAAGRALPEGDYTLTASAYPDRDGGGAAIQTLSATFAVEAPPPPARLTGLAVVDAETGAEIAVADGDMLRLPADGRYRLRADAARGAEIGSVRLRLDGPPAVWTFLRMDNAAPYVLTPNSDRTGAGGALPAGTYRFRAWAWSKQEGYGSLLEGLEVSFTVAVRALDALELVDATADAVQGAVEDGAELTVTQGVDYNFRAVPAAGAGVESVRLELRGPGSSDVVSRTENAAPYTLLGDAGGDYAGAELAAGSYTLSATAYPEPDGAGEALQTLTVAFTVVATAPAVVEEPLTAAFEDLPEHHAGEPFEFRIVFSAAVDIGEDAFREHALAVGNASVTAASRVADEPGAWVVTVAPDSTAAVELRLEAGRECDEEGALCTAAGTRLSAGLLTMVGGPPPAGVLAGFMLVDAESGNDLGPVADGATVRLADPAGGSYDVRVETAADAGIGSVRLALAGPGDGDAAARTDDAAPWLLRGATDGTGAGAPLPVGSYTLTATAWAGANGEGAELGSLSVAFTVARSVLTGFVLVDATAHADAGALADGARLTGLDAAKVYGFRAEVAADDGTVPDDDVESVTFVLSGTALDKDEERTESWAPYSLYGDSGGNEHGAALADGAYTLTATAWSGNNGEGDALDTLSVEFAVGDAEPETPAEPLTAAFEEVPESHAGPGTPFTLRLAFSEPIEIEAAAFAAHGLIVGNATVSAAARIEGAPGAWEVTLAPTSREPVTVTLAADRACGEEGALCTADGRALGSAPAASIAGPGPVLAGFELVDLDAGGERTALTDGMELTLSDASGGNYGIVAAIAEGETVGSVAFVLDEPGEDPDVTHTEGVAPYSLYGDDLVNPNGAPLPAGRYALSATAWSGPGATGTELGTLVVGFTVRAPTDTAVIPDTEPAVTGFKLVDRVENTTVALADGMTVELADPSAQRWAIVAEVAGDDVKSVTLALSGAKTVSPRTENVAPWSLYGDDLVNPYGKTLPPGSYTLTATAWSEKNLGGDDLGTLRVRFTVVGPPALSVADATVTEGSGATLDFLVTLDRAASGPVTVEYATVDSGATAGEDYEAASGTLSFQPGETLKTVSVTVLDDAVDDGGEQVKFVLFNATGAWIADSEAFGTIENSDPMPSAWLVRFGRTVGSQVVDAVTARFEAPGASHLTLGGQRLSLDGEAGDAEGADRLSAHDEQAARETLTALADRFADPADPADGGTRDRGQAGAWSVDGWMRDGAGADERTMTGRELLLGSSFHLAAGGEDGAAAVAAWGRVATGGFDAEVDDVRLDGAVTTAMLGADVAHERWLAGAAVTLSEGTGGYAFTADAESDLKGGDVESRLTGVFPYARLNLSDRVSAWGLLGYGTGTLTLTEERGDAQKRYSTDIGLRMGAVGARGTVLTPEESGGFELAVRTDAMLLRTTSDATGGMAASQSDASRLRLILDGSRSFEAGGGTLTPRLEVGLRHDGGDAETGTGVEVGAGLRYQANGIAVEGAVRGLVAHEDEDYREWGASGSVRIDPGASGRGLSLTLRPTWGAASSGTERLWGLRDASGLGASEAFEPERRLDAELGYGFSVLGDRGVATPYAGWSQAGERETLRLGQRLRLGQATEWRLEGELGEDARTWRAGYGYRLGSGLSFTTEASRREAANDDAPEHGIALRATLRW